MQRRHPGEVGGEAVDHQVDLHLADLGHVVVLSFTPGSSSGTAWPTSWLLGVLELLLHLADERRVLFQQLPVLRADGRADLVQVVLEVVEDALQALLVLHAAVELGEHLVGIVDRRDRLVRPGVDHAGPGVGAVGHHHAKLERAEPGARVRPALQVSS